MSGKGSGRRPQEAPDEQVADNWARIFGDRKAAPKSDVYELYPALGPFGIPMSEWGFGKQKQAQADHKDVE